jgi:hypothetical protein
MDRVVDLSHHVQRTTGEKRNRVRGILGFLPYNPLAVPFQFLKVEIVTLFKVIEDVLEGTANTELMDAESI